MTVARLIRRMTFEADEPTIRHSNGLSPTASAGCVGSGARWCHATVPRIAHRVAPAPIGRLMPQSAARRIDPRRAEIWIDHEDADAFDDPRSPIVGIRLVSGLPVFTKSGRSRSGSASR
jgi:hypothetical protein